MAPTASIVIPTRGRPDYLAVALTSVAPQARRASAEVIVVEDDAATRETRGVAERHGARHVALGEFRGINVARNTGLELATAELVCFLDDDVEVWPGWLAAMLAGAAAAPGADAFGGPIRARLEGVRLPTCGREPPPITTLDLGPEDRDAEFAWGANLALRSRAVARIGGFDADLNYCGDEEDWQRRLKATGGRVRYVAGAGVDHRRTGADAGLWRLSRSAWFRGFHARRYDVRKQTAPCLRAELRVLAGCVWHTGRYRCANGVVLGAMAAGRVRAALGERAETGDDVQPDFLSGRSGTLSRRGVARARVLDGLVAGLVRPRTALLRRAAARTPQRRVLVLGVARAHNADRVAAIRAELERTHHRVEIHLEPGAAGAGKWANLNAVLASHPVQDHDWLLIVDDDVELPRGFLDAFLLCCESAELVLAQPAHAYASHAAWPVTRRRPGVVARRTHFVEIGPVTAIAAWAFADLLPFPDLRMGWGLDFLWSGIARQRKWPVGIVDATPIRHLAPVAAEYPRADAVEEGRRLLDGRPRISRAEADATVARRLTWRS